MNPEAAASGNAPNRHHRPGDRPPPDGETPTSTDDLDQWFHRVASSDREAFALLYDALAPLVYGVVRRAVADVATAEAVTTDVFVRLWRDAPAMKLPSGVLARWVALDAHRRAQDWKL